MSGLEGGEVAVSVGRVEWEQLSFLNLESGMWSVDINFKIVISLFRDEKITARFKMFFYHPTEFCWLHRKPVQVWVSYCMSVNTMN